MVMEVVNVHYQGEQVAAASFDTRSGQAAFEYAPAFLDSGIELSPLKMPLKKGMYSFPALEFSCYKGLPGLLADSLPDDFGNAVLNAWIAAQGRQPEEITPLQRLQYIGKRGMGALEYSPATRLKNLNASQQLALDSLIELAQEVLDQRQGFSTHINASGAEDKEAMMALLSVGTSAGGARPKAVLAFNESFDQVRSGQTDIPDGFTHCLLKFDGVREQRPGQEAFGDPLGYGAMEYVYHLMATAAGIEMMPCWLLDEGKRRHFVTQRYDRTGNQKRHVQTLNGIAHINYQQPGVYSYAELFAVARQLKLTAQEAEQLFRRMVFNVVARNHDDHSKNFSFVLSEQGQWRLAPAYDLAYSYKPGSKWVNSHWMSLNGKRDDFNRQDFYSFEALSPIFTRRKIDAVIDEVTEHCSRWPVLAVEHAVPRVLADTVAENLRLGI